MGHWPTGPSCVDCLGGCLPTPVGSLVALYPYHLPAPTGTRTLLRPSSDTATVALKRLVGAFMSESPSESTDDHELRDDRPQCAECGEYIDDWAVRVMEGYWTGSKFDGDPLEDYYCRDCYREHYRRETAAHYEIDDHERLWAILEAADGELVADTYPLTIGGRGYVRVVDGEPQALGITTRRKEDRIIAFEAEPIDDYDREDFAGLFSVEDDGDEDPPRIVYLKPADETPFAEWSQLPEGQSTLIEEADGG